MSFSDCVVKAIKSIPEGYVASYGQIALVCGNPRAARAVVQVIKKQDDLPWYRVVNSRGMIRIPGEHEKITQKSLLESEGIMVVDNVVVNLRKHLYDFSQMEGSGFNG